MSSVTRSRRAAPRLSTRQQHPAYLDYCEGCTPDEVAHFIGVRIFRAPIERERLGAVKIVIPPSPPGLGSARPPSQSEPYRKSCASAGLTANSDPASRLPITIVRQSRPVFGVSLSAPVVGQAAPRELSPEVTITRGGWPVPRTRDRLVRTYLRSSRSSRIWAGFQLGRRLVTRSR